MQVESTIIILSWNGKQYLHKCLQSLLTTTGTDDEVILVDNGSTDGTPDFVREHFPTVSIYTNSQNLGVAAGWNVGIDNAKGRHLFFVNQDVFVREYWLLRMKEGLAKPGIGIVGCKLLYPDGLTVQHAGARIRFPLGLTKHVGDRQEDRGQFDIPMNVDYVTGAAFGTSRKVFNTIGTFDAGFYPAYYEDVDFCLRANEAGLGVLYLPEAVALHLQSSSLGAYTEAFYYAYHLNRIRLVHKYAYRVDFREFHREESHRNKSGRSQNELKALKRVYRDLLEMDYDSRDMIQALLLSLEDVLGVHGLGYSDSPDGSRKFDSK